MSTPVDIATWISELVNKKPNPPEDDLKDALGEMARDIALIEPDLAQSLNSAGMAAAFIGGTSKYYSGQLNLWI